MFVMNILSSDSPCAAYAAQGIGLAPFALAVFSIPVSDTVRVMTSRILRGTSPFYPDKTHLHHLFIDLGFSHTGTTVTILSLNSLVIIAWYISYLLGASIDVQFYVVFALSFLFTIVFYWFARKQIDKQGSFLRFLQRIGNIMHFEKKGNWLKFQNFVDRF